MLSPINRKIQLVMFDFDGTLVDTAPDLVRTANLYLKSKDLSPLSEDVIRKEIGFGLRRLIVEIYPEKNKDEAFRKKIENEFIAVYEQEYLTSPTAFYGIHEFLNDFDGQVAIVSNKRERFIKPILKKLSLDHYPWVRIVGGDTFSQMKPHPEPFCRVMEAAGVTPEETLIVGDGYPDIEGALAIGCRSVVVGFGYTPPHELMDLGATYLIESYDELYPLIQRIT
jgi:phosphoglycolate phosphatase